jgi:rhodanese-related sulfurtransferase
MVATISRDELKAKIDHEEKFQLIEVLPAEKFRECHLPAARNMPLAKIPELAPRMLPDKRTEVVVYCGSWTCSASEDAAQELAAKGYTNVRRYIGGKQDWIDAGLPTVNESLATTGV